MVIGVLGEGWCFLIDGFSYFAVIASLLLMRIKPLDIRRNRASMFIQMREGWDYVRTFRPIRTILLLFSLISLMGHSYAVLLPVFAAQVLHGGAATLGWLTGASGVGALVSAVSLAVRKSVLGLTRMVQIAAAMLGGRADSAWPVAYVVVVDCTDGHCWLRLNPGRVRQQHDHPGVGDGRQARPRDELLHDGFFRLGAVRQSAGRRVGSPHRSTPHRYHHGRILRGRLVLVHAPIAKNQCDYAANVPGDGPAARAQRRPDFRRTGDGALTLLICSTERNHCKRNVPGSRLREADPCRSAMCPNRSTRDYLAAQSFWRN